MIEYKIYNKEEFNDFVDDIKWDAYSELANEFKRRIKENERQYILLQNKQDIIIKLKRILYAIIESIGDDD